MNFAELHNQHEPLLTANVWDAASAVAAQEAGYQALGTSSAAIASTMGYEDGQGMSFDELFYMVTRIRAISNLPLSVDMEAGYGDSAEEIATNLRRLAQIGVSSVMHSTFFERNIASSLSACPEYSLANMEHLLARKKSGDHRMILAQYS